VNITYVTRSENVPAGLGWANIVSCPANTYVVGGSCGYTGFDVGVFDMRVVYAGTDNRSTYRCVVVNSGSRPPPADLPRALRHRQLGDGALTRPARRPHPIHPRMKR
jgi:hypothetical protein